MSVMWQHTANYDTILYISIDYDNWLIVTILQYSTIFICQYTVVSSGDYFEYIKIKQLKHCTLFVADFALLRSQKTVFRIEDHCERERDWQSSASTLWAGVFSYLLCVIFCLQTFARVLLHQIKTI